MRWVLIAFSVAVLSVVILTMPLFPQNEGMKTRFVVKEIPIGKLHPGILIESIEIGPNGRRFAYLAFHYGKQLVVVDGKGRKRI
ncbi:MAG: hypothetical protein RMK18_09495 [Armatimonadota bacterium]|nr:hypothetical protein [Armatimonadota bacterium]MDW8026077.1 hypothetical protein [Armatimonadota bacterium]